MKLINTDGMALIGPGSEWFWTAVSWIILGHRVSPGARLTRAGGTRAIASGAD